MEGLSPVMEPFCTVCGTPFTGGAGGGHPCHACMKDPPHFDSARASLVYAGLIKEAVHLFKYGHVRAVKEFLGGFIQETAIRWFGGSDVVAAVPLHYRRFRARGFNQSLFMAEYASLAVGARLSIDALARIRNTRPQVELGPAEREENVRGAFSVLSPREFEGASVLLVDDVYTTGATVKECSRVLKAAGANSVSVLTVARAV